MGKLHKPIRRTAEAVERFWSFVEIGDSDDCWLWKGPTFGPDRTGMVYGDAGGVGAHRVAYWIEHGHDPTSDVLRHVCHTPLCCNPSHLLDGTHKENTADARAAGRLRGRSRGPVSYLSDNDKRYIATAKDDRGRRLRAAILAKQFDIHPQTVANVRREWRQQQQNQS